MSDRPKFPREAALPVAKELCDFLQPFCERLVVAGSLRRRKKQVGDVELLFISRTEKRPDGLFDSLDFDLAEEAITTLLKRGILTQRPNIAGQFTWGAENKLAVHVASRIPVDLFKTDEKRWWNALVVRTGGKNNNLLITTTAQRKGWSFEAYGSGFHKLLGTERHDTTSEEDVYAFLGLEYKQPWERL